MRNIIYSLITLFLFLLINNNSFAGTPKIYAVVVGVSKYKDASIPNLKYSEKDAQAFYDFLKSPYAGAIPEENIALLLGANATRSNIIKEVVDIFDRSTKDDMIIFYFSGHGVGDESDNSGYLLSYDAEYGNEPATALAMDELENKIDKRQAKLKVSYVDACHAGLFKSNGKGTMEDDNAIIAKAYTDNIANANDGNVAFLASSARQQSLEDDKLGNGVFTYYLLKGLKGDADKEQKDADGYNDGLVTVGEMATYLGDKIPAATKYKQKPTVEGTYDEGFPLSVLRSNVVIANEIGKRPEKKIVPKLKLTAAIEKPEDKKLSPGQTYDGIGACFGVCTFINNSKFNLNLYTIQSPWSPIASSVQVVSGKSSQALRIRLTSGTDSKKANDCNDLFKDCAFYFVIDDNGTQKYATFNSSVEAGKSQYFMIDDGTLTFTTTKPSIN